MKDKAINCFIEADSLNEIKLALKEKVRQVERLLPYWKEQINTFTKYLEEGTEKIRVLNKIITDIEKGEG